MNQLWKMPAPDSASADDAESMKRIKMPPPDRSRRALACPFWKSDPLKHRKCFPRLLYSLGRVKQHLIRCHAPSFYCSRCFEVFETDDKLHSHFTSDGLCDLASSSDGLDFITYDIRCRLARKSNPRFSEEEKWFAIWDVLFPGHPRPYSVYVDTEISLDLAQFCEYLNSYGTRILSKALKAAYMDNNKESVDLREVMQKGLEQIHTAWTRSRNSDTLFASLEGSNSSTPGLRGSDSSVSVQPAVLEKKSVLLEQSRSNQDENRFIEPGSKNEDLSTDSTFTGFESFQLPLARPIRDPKSRYNDNTTVIDSGISILSDTCGGRNQHPSSDAPSDYGSTLGDMDADLKFLLGLYDKMSCIERMKLDLRRQIDDFLSQREDLRDDFVKLIRMPQDDGESDEGNLLDNVQHDRASVLPAILEATKATTDISESEFSSQDSDDVLSEEMAIVETTLQTVFGLTVEDANISVDKWKPLVLDFVKGLHDHIWRAPEGADNPRRSHSIPPDESSHKGEGGSTALGKRARGGGGDGDGIEDDTNGGNARARTAKKPRIGDTLVLRFSCPYRKRNPEKFNVRQRYSCSMTFFSTIAKVRDHITSQHRREAIPGIACQCCKTIFATQNDLDMHNRALPTERCSFKELDPLDGISSDTFSKLTNRKGPYGREDGEQWSELWKLVFPMDNYCDVRPPDYHAVMEHFELRDQYLSSLQQLMSSLDNPDKQLETKIRKHFLRTCEELERKAKDMDYVNDQSRLKGKTLLGKIERQMRRQAGSESTASLSSSAELLPPVFPGGQPKTGGIPTPESSKSSNEANAMLQCQNSGLLPVLQPCPVPASGSTSVAFPSMPSNPEFEDGASSHSARLQDTPLLPASLFLGPPTTSRSWSRMTSLLPPALYEPTADMSNDVFGSANDDPGQQAMAADVDNIISETWLEPLDDIGVFDMLEQLNDSR